MTFYLKVNNERMLNVCLSKASMEKSSQTPCNEHQGLQKKKNAKLCSRITCILFNRGISKQKHIIIYTS